ncbi:MAG: hypothetical protein Q4G08_09210, partial [Capnocytophaga sp.]|nr:hypothetical protein [Capnocytophaga sp.]
MKLILSLFILSLFFSCSHKNERLEFALRQAGNNRSELEKVLAHYQGDSLKYRSAVFLMENMPYYAYEQSAGIDSIKQLLPQIFQKESWTEAERQKGIRWQRQGGRIIKRDIEEVKAAMLIENIDLAFEVWQNRAWNKHLPFTDFCELLLPYRIADEP